MKIDKIMGEDFAAYFAPPGLEGDLKKELRGFLFAQSTLVLAPSPRNSKVYFFDNHWAAPRLLKITSRHQLAQYLTEYWRGQRMPVYYQDIGRAPKIEFSFSQPEEYGFPITPPKTRKWLECTQLSDDYALVAEQIGEFPLGQYKFKKDTSAPSRAYLKLWELLTRINRHPNKDSVCLELGSAPGGWTYVLNQLECQVISVDRAELSPDLMKQPNVRHFIRDAFSVTPEDFGEIDWFFSDLICFPDRLFDFVRQWRDSGKVKNFVCTLKFKGATDWSSIKKFEGLGGELIHLNQNKHELTWCLLKDE